MRDFRQAVRALRAAPIVSVIAILSLALGIGANTAMFSLVDSLLLRSLPVKDPGRLALLTYSSSRGDTMQWWSYPQWEEIRRRPDLFEASMAWGLARFNLASGGATEFVDGLWASGSFFDTLGVSPLLGRTFTPADDTRGGGPDGPVAVISYSFWQRRFGGDPGAIGRTIGLEGVAFTIVGVTPPGFFGPDVGRAFDVIVPVGDQPLASPADSRLERRNMSWLPIMVRLKPGQTLEAGTAAVRGVQPQIRAATVPDNWPKREADRYLTTPFTLVPAATGMSIFRSQYERPLLALMAIVALVLLVACANIANLLLARATARRHELSVRVALGASRWHIVRQLLVESFVLAAGGAAIGLLFASWFSRLLVRELSTQTNTVFLDLSIDSRVLAFTVAVTAATALLFGIVPALRGSGAPPIDALKAHGPASAERAGGGVASGLVVAQVALSLVLVVAAGLFVRTFAALAGRDLGFERDRVLLVTIDSRRSEVAPADRISLYYRIRDAARAVPGVGEAAVSLVTPVSGMTIQNRVNSVSGGVALPETESVAMVNVVTPGWFGTFGTPIVAGRDLLEADRKGAPQVAVVNQAFARKFLNGASPLGHTISTTIAGPTPRVIEIVGVAADAVYRSLKEPPRPTMYLALAQWPDSPMFLASASLGVRPKTGPPVDLTRSVAAAITGVDPRLALTFRPLADQVNASLVQERVVAILSLLFGGLALLLAALGIYGVTSYAVARRKTEIGIRMALGAEPRRVVALVLARVAVLVGGGVIAGVILSAWAGRFAGALLYQVTPRDPVTLAGAAAVLAAAGGVAGWLPARRAARTDPATVLREA